MRVAIVHYHLGPGGVTRVIESTSRTLTGSSIAHVILTGASGDGWDFSSQPLPHRAVPGLGYLAVPGDFTPEGLFASMLEEATDALSGAPDVWHFHNHSLGKNCLIADVVALLSRTGAALLLQIHDLAENGRPENYALIAGCRELYPFSPRIRYAFLNSRDLETFTAAGLPCENAVLLQNPIEPLPRISEAPPKRPAILFAPVRGIRRKNLGELVLLAALAPGGVRVAVSRAPLSPAALPVHDRWEKFAGKHRVPIAFDVVSRFAPAANAPTTFEAWVEHATHFITTSVAEGFGLPFLESIAWGKPLVGRNIPHLTTDHGVRTGRFYQHILVPVDWVDETVLRSYLTTTLERNHRLYQRPLSNALIEVTLNELVRNGLVDFGNLPESLQQGIIEKMAEKSCRSMPLVELEDGTNIPLEDWLAEVIGHRTPTAAPTQLERFSPGLYGKTLAATYQELIGQPATPVRLISPQAILSAHLAPGSFHFLLSALEPDLPPRKFRAVIFDIYGTLLIAPAGGVKVDPDADPLLREILERFGYTAPESPSTALHEAVLRHHASAATLYPEIDLRVLWREILSIEPGTDVAPLVEAIELAWHPSRPMPGAERVIQNLSRSGMSLGLLSNAQCNSLTSLGAVADLFAPELTLLSYQHGIAKPAPELFQMLADRLAGRKICPAETLYIGNDPLHDIVPAANAGFKTALFTGDPSALRNGECSPDYFLKDWADLAAVI